MPESMAPQHVASCWSRPTRVPHTHQLLRTTSALPELILGQYRHKYCPLALAERNIDKHNSHNIMPHVVCVPTKGGIMPHPESSIYQRNKDCVALG